MDKDPIRLNLGCASRPLPGYVNIDMDSLEDMKVRYPDVNFPEDVSILQCDIFNLPYEDDAVDEVKADALLEHLSFLDEKKLFYEVKRVLRPGGVFEFSVPDFEETVKLWLAAKDEWKDFYRNDPEAVAKKHWFGQYSFSFDNRWGYLTACIFGPQNSEGQFHRNCYTVPKIRAILDHIGFAEVAISNFKWKGNTDLPMVRVKAKKK
jgi:predicted SAM-dependent methyltransferase